MAQPASTNPARAPTVMAGALTPAILLVSALLLTGAGSGAIQSPVSVHLVLKTSACGASNADRPIYLSLSHSGSPGRPMDPSRLEITSTETNVLLAPGYYDGLLTGRGCWEQHVWFSVLPGLSRTIELQYESFVAVPGTDYLPYEIPHGAIAGTIPAAVVKVQIIRPWWESANKTDFVMTPEIVAGAYYADTVYTGQYIVRATTANDVKEITVDVKQFSLQTANFTLGDFDQVKSGSE